MKAQETCTPPLAEGESTLGAGSDPGLLRQCWDRWLIRSARRRLQGQELPEGNKVILKYKLHTPVAI